MASPYTYVLLGPVTLEKIFIPPTIDETVGKSDSFSKCHLLSASVDFCDSEREVCEVTRYPPKKLGKVVDRKNPKCGSKKSSQDFHVQPLLSVNAQKAASQNTLWSM